MAKLMIRNVIKNLVKQNQRFHDYESPYGVKFWNKILKDAKMIDTKKRKKCREWNVPKIINRNYEYWTRCLNKENLTEQDKIKYETYLELIEPFRNGTWRKILNLETRRPENFEERKWINKNGEEKSFWVFKPIEEEG